MRSLSYRHASCMPTSVPVKEHQDKILYPSSTDPMNVVFTIIREIIILHKQNEGILEKNNSILTIT